MEHETQPQKKVLLIGGAGYIGSVLTEFLLEKNYYVRSLDFLLYQNHFAISSFLNHKNFEFIYGDFINESILALALQDITDVVILAGLVGEPITNKYPQLSNKINYEGIKKLIYNLNSKELDRVIFISTCSNYGLLGIHDVADENFTLKPLSLYAKAKVAIEQELLSLKGKINYCPIILRFATAFGVSPRMRFDLTVNQFTRDLFFNKELEIYDAETWRPYCHVKDFSRLIFQILETPRDKVSFEVFNVGEDSSNFTKKMIIEEIKAYFPSARVFYKKNGQDKRNYRVAFKKVYEYFSFKPSYSISDGIRELILGLKKDIYSKSDHLYGNFEINYL